MAVELFGSAASRLHQSSLPSSGSAFYGKAGECLIRRTAVVRTRMPGGVGGVAPRGVPLSRLQRVAGQPSLTIKSDGWFPVAAGPPDPTTALCEDYLYSGTDSAPFMRGFSPPPTPW